MSLTIDLTGQTALITGGTRGIGLASAQRLVEAGARVAVMSRHAEQARAMAEHAWSYVRDRYSLSRMLADYDELYRRILS